MCVKKTKCSPCIIVHGCAWSIPNPFFEAYFAGVQEAGKPSIDFALSTFVAENMAKYPNFFCSSALCLKLAE